MESAKRQRRERRASARQDRAPGKLQRLAGKGPAAFMRHGVAAILGLVSLVAVAYFPALSGGFIWDDIIFSEEPTIRQWSGLSSIWFSPTDIQREGHYWPVVYTTFWLEHKLWGFSPFGYHLVNVLLHTVNVVLVWRLMQRLAVPGALAIAAVFAVHPLHVESVAWIIERKDLLSALFYLSAVLMWIRFTEAPHPWRYSAALVLFTAGMLSKSIVVTLPAALLIWHWWQHGRIAAKDLLRLAPFFLVGFAITLADLAYYTSREPLALDYSAIERILIAARALWFYVDKLLWPVDLIVIYPLWEIRADHLFGWVYVAAAAALGAALWHLRHRLGRGPLAAALFFVVTLSPVLGFVDYGYMQFSLVADRFQYLAGIGPMAVLLGGAVGGVNRLPDVWRRIAVGVFIAVLAVLGTLTWQQSRIYRDGITFFSYIVSHNPAARDAHLNLGNALFKADRIQEGYAATLVEAGQRPHSTKVYAHLGYALLLMNRLDEAAVRLARALEIDSKNPQALDSLAMVRFRQRRYDEALTLYQSMMEVQPDNAQTHSNLGSTLYHLGRLEDALASFESALALDPGLEIARGSANRLRRRLSSDRP